MEHDMDMTRLKAGELNLGTSIMAVAFEGGVVIGADSRTTSGSYIVSCHAFSWPFQSTPLFFQEEATSRFLSRSDEYLIVVWGSVG